MAAVVNPSCSSTSGGISTADEHVTPGDQETDRRDAGRGPRRSPASPPRACGGPAAPTHNAQNRQATRARTTERGRDPPAKGDGRLGIGRGDRRAGCHVSDALEHHVAEADRVPPQTGSGRRSSCFAAIDVLRERCRSMPGWSHGRPGHTRLNQGKAAKRRTRRRPGTQSRHGPGPASARGHAAPGPAGRFAGQTCPAAAQSPLVPGLRRPQASRSAVQASRSAGNCARPGRRAAGSGGCGARGRGSRRGGAAPVEEDAAAGEEGTPASGQERRSPDGPDIPGRHVRPGRLVDRAGPGAHGGEIGPGAGEPYRPWFSSGESPQPWFSADPQDHSS